MMEQRKLKRILRKVNQWSDKVRQMSDEELQHQTVILKEQLKKGKTLDQLLPHAFATIREADYRILGLYPYDVQVMGAIVLHQGNIAEMKTGEGKTLTATMPLYLNALTGKGVMLMTTGDYLASRDQAQLAPVYQWLGLTSSLGFLPENSDEPQPDAKKKREWYQADIVYTTGSTVAFDYLQHNLADSLDDQYMRPFNYAIIDEVDAVLLDEAGTPFVIAGAPQLQSNVYEITNNFVETLQRDRDFKLKKRENAIWLTYQGVRKAEAYFRLDNLYAPENREIYRHIALALRAHYFMIKGKDYLVVDGQVVLLDETDGRLKYGIKVGTGLHQAVEQKEGVAITNNQMTSASITYASLFGMFNKIAGMSGTAKVDENEFMNIYKLKVIKIPTNKPTIRKDYRPRIYLTTQEKLMHAIGLVLKLHQAGRPILLVTGSVENSEIVSEILLNQGIPHNVLNAFNSAQEAAIVKEAGQRGAVTIATNMAGRGTDIKLGPGVAELGGLAVIGTEMLPKRVEQQLSGRAGRQGDPGTSQFFISLEDSYISTNSTTRFKNFYRHMLKKRRHGKRARELRSPRLRIALEMLRNRVSGGGEGQREETNKYELGLKIQRSHLYQQRQRLMEQPYLEDTTQHWIDKGIDTFLAEKDQWTIEDVYELVNEHITYDEITIPTQVVNDSKQLKNYLKSLIKQRLTARGKQLGSREYINQFYRKAILNALDSCWVYEVAYLEDLRTRLQNFQKMGRDPGYLYQVDALKSYQKMLTQAYKKALDNLLLSRISMNEKHELVVVF